MITDAMLKTATDELDRALLAKLADDRECTHKFSDRFERKMKKVIYRANHPLISRLGFRVAAAILALLLVGGSVLLVSPGARAAFTGWLKEIYEDCYHYFVPNSTTDDIPTAYHPTWLPEGCTLVDEREDDNGKALVFVDPNGNLLRFSYYFSPTAIYTDLFVGAEGYACKKIPVGKQEADLYVDENGMNRGLIWSDDGGKVLFYIAAQLDTDTLVQIAENVVAKEK